MKKTLKFLRKIISIILARITLLIGKAVKRGSSAPGIIAYKFNKNIFNDLERPKLVIVVTGSSGKGSTTNIIASILRKNNLKVAYNDKGSNQRPAIITTLIENSNLFGKTKVDAAVFELDERSAKYVIPFINPDYTVITNITKDQPPRQRHIDFIFEEIERSLPDNSNLILNGDDPYLLKFNELNKFNCTFFGINKTMYSYNKNIFTNLNISRCPRCNHTLKYDYYHIEHLGKYKCNLCNLERPKLKYSISNYDEKTNNITINRKYKIYIENDMLFNFYNTLGAFALLDKVNIDKDKIAKQISKINKDKKIFNIYKNKKRKVYVMNNKNENATTFNQSILYTLRNNNPKVIVIGWKEISRRYQFDDLSWLYDIDFELLNNKTVTKIILVGPQRYDLATRMKYAGFSEKIMRVYPNLDDAKDEILKTKEDIYAILNFDYIKPFDKIMGVKK